MPPKSTATKPKYSEGEKILCFHGPLLYEAKCHGVEVKDGQIKYFVHYQGWNKNWDEWVGDARIMKFNAVGLQKQKELKEFYSKPGKKVKGLRKSELLNQEYPPAEALRHLETAAPDDPSRPQPPPPPPPPPPQQPSTPCQVGGSGAKRARRESTDELTAQPAAATAAAPVAASTAAVGTPGGGASESAVGGSGGGGGGKRLRIQIELPRLLKLWLADDADLVCRQRRLHALPPQPGLTVSGILSRFAASQAVEEPERERLSEFAAGVQSYFNAVLSTQLLYPAERHQYSALLKGHRGAMPSSLYGCVHLTRLFVRLGELVSQTKLDLKCLNSLLDYCDTLLLFLEKNIDSFVSLGSYEPASV